MSTMINKTAVPDTDAARSDRLSMFISYGFSPEQSELLASARDGLWPLHHLKVKRALDVGATHEQAMSFFS